MLTSQRETKALPGFYCEVQGPTGVWEAYTADAHPPQGARRTAQFDLPTEKASAFLLFPKEFVSPDGSEFTRARLTHGRYYVLWWAWKRSVDRLSVQLDFVSCCWFGYGLAGGVQGKAEADFRSGGCPPKN